MASSTRQALAQAKADSSAYLGSDLAFATDLFVVADAISSSTQLRGILSDSSTESAAKDDLIDRVFKTKVSANALEFVKKVVALRFSRSMDLVFVLEQLGVHAASATASKTSVLDQVQDELFSFQQVVASDRDLQFALSNKSAPNETKLALVKALIGSKAHLVTQALVNQAVGSARGRRVAVVIDQFAKQVAAYGQSLVATVTVSKALDQSQVERLRSTLAGTYGQQVSLNVEIDPSILGGMVVQIAGEIIDGSVSTRLQNLKLQLAKASGSINRS
jgi:F-type H+-transporting ATPase subunit delta